jgi:hypothetical protein
MGTISALRAGARHVAGVSLEAIVLALIITLVLVLAGPIYRPATTLSGTADVEAGGRNSGHISVPDASFGTITTATVNPGGDNVWVYAECYQNGIAVYGQYAKADVNNHAALGLGPTPLWQGGAATCMAQEGYWSKTMRWRVLAQTTFQALD